MSIDRIHLNFYPIAERFLDHLVENSGHTFGPNVEACAIFTAIQHCYCGVNDESVAVSSYMLHYLGVCAWVSLEYDRDKLIPWDQGDHEYALIRAYKGLINTLVGAIKEGRVKVRNGEVYVNELHLPSWFVEWARDWKHAPVSTAQIAAAK